jgi:hypothetical protein
MIYVLGYWGEKVVNADLKKDKNLIEIKKLTLPISIKTYEKS